MGRVLIEEDDRPNINLVVVLSHDFWTNRFGADPQIVGKNIRLNGNLAGVVGVMPPGFSFPRPGVDLRAPLQIDPANMGSRQSHYLQVVARLSDDVPLASAEADTEQMMTRWEADYPDIHTAHFLFLTPLLEDRVGNFRTALLLLVGAVGFKPQNGAANAPHRNLATGVAAVKILAISRVRSGPVIIF
jgi:putative ABC transport system permease protein